MDDGSDDDTREVVSQFNDKVIYLHQENKERSAARNNGMRHARGQYITFLDSDDLYLPDKLRIQVESMDKNPECGMSCTYSIWLNEEGRYLHTWRPSLDGWIYPEMMRVKHNKIALPSVMIRREIPDGGEYFNESLNTCEDLEYWCRITKNNRVLLIKKGLVVINTDTRPSNAVFYNHLNSTLKYYGSIFKADTSVTESVKRKIYTDLSVKYYLNSTSGEDKKNILNTIKKLNPSSLPFTKLKILSEQILDGIRKYNGIRTVFMFCKNYILIGLPVKIFAEDFEYGVIKELKLKEDIEKVKSYYKKNEAENSYIPSGNSRRSVRKEVRELLIATGYLPRNRIAMLLNI